MDWQLLSFILAGFLAVMLLLEGGFLLWNTYRGAEALRIQSRLRVLSAGGALSLDAQIVKRELGERVPGFYRLMLGEPRLQQLDRVLLQSGLQRTLPGLFTLCSGAASCGFLLWALLPVSWWAAPPLVLGLGALPLAQVLYVRMRRLRAIEEQLPEALD